MQTKYYAVLHANTKIPHNATRKIANRYSKYKYHFATLQNEFQLHLDKGVPMILEYEDLQHEILTPLQKTLDTAMCKYIYVFLGANISCNFLVNQRSRDCGCMVILYMFLHVVEVKIETATVENRGLIYVKGKKVETLHTNSILHLSAPGHYTGSIGVTASQLTGNETVKQLVHVISKEPSKLCNTTTPPLHPYSEPVMRKTFPCRDVIIDNKHILYPVLGCVW